ADYFARIIAIQQERTNAILAHRANSVTEYQPAGIGFDRRSTVPKLDQFPRKRRIEERLALIPEVDIIGEHEIDVLVILPREHGIMSVYFPRKHRHTFVLRGWTVERDESKKEEIGSLDQLRHHHLTVVGCKSCVID